MLADQLDYVVGVDPHRDSHELAVVHIVSGAIVYEATVNANSDGVKGHSRILAHASAVVARHAAWFAKVHARNRARSGYLYGYLLPLTMNATRSAILVVLSVLANVVGMIPLW
jgi:hypothetical protein